MPDVDVCNNHFDESGRTAVPHSAKKSSIDYGETQFRRFMSRTDGFKIRLEKCLAEKIVCVVKKSPKSFRGAHSAQRDLELIFRFD